MKSLGLAPNMATYTTLVDALCRDGQVIYILRCIHIDRYMHMHIYPSIYLSIYLYK